MFVKLILFSAGIIFVMGDCIISSRRASCTYMNLTSVPVYLPRKIISLDLTGNSIQRLVARNFYRYSALEQLIINNNKIFSMSMDTFVGLSRLKSLSLRGNNLNISHAYPDDIFKPISHLEKLDISRNTEKNTLDKNERYNLPTKDLAKLRELSIDLISTPYFGVQFKLLYSLEKLKFDFCKADSLNGTFRNFPNGLKEFYLNSCKHFITVDPGVLAPFPNLSILDLTNSNVQLTSALEMLRPLQNGTMDGIYFRGISWAIGPLETTNSITLTSEHMKYFNNICVRTIDISDNRIVAVEGNALYSSKYPQCLENILCTGNRFSMNGWATQFFLYLGSLKNLKLLDYSYLPLQFPEPVFIDVYRSSQNKWSYKTTQNKYKPKYYDAILYIPQSIRFIRFTHLMAIQQFREFKCHNSELEHLEISYFDTQLFPYITFKGSNKMKHLDLSGIDSSLTLGEGKVSHLEHLQTLILVNVKLYHVIKTNSTIFHWCPNIHRLDLSYNYLWFIRQESFGPLDQLISLNLSHNMLTEAPEILTLFPRLTELDLSYNEFASLPSSLLKWMDGQRKIFGSFKLYLDKNPFICSCETKDFVEWLARTDVTCDNYGNYSCMIPKPKYTKGYTTNVSNHLHDYFVYCDSSTWLKIGIGLLAGFCGVLIIVIVMYNIRWRLVYNFERILRKFGERILGIKLPYDAYFSYSHENDVCRGRAKEVLFKIECYGFKSYFTGRDSIPGEDEFLKMAEAIHKSRNFIFFDLPVVTENDIKTRQYEIKRAMYEYVENNMRKIIVITENDDIASTKIIHEWFSVVLKKDIKIIKWPARQENCGDFYHHLRLHLTFT